MNNPSPSTAWPPIRNATSLRSRRPGDIDPESIAPIRPGVRGGARKCPKPEPLRIHLAQIRKPCDYANRIRMQPRFAIVEMLNHAEGRIADERLRVDH